MHACVQVRIVEEANSVLAALASAAFLKRADECAEAADSECVSSSPMLSGNFEPPLLGLELTGLIVGCTRPNVITPQVPAMGKTSVNCST